MTLNPESIEQLQTQLAQAQQVGVVSLQGVARLVEHVPEDMTATVEAGMTLAELQERLARGGQWLPVDPPDPGSVTIGDLLANNLHGPRRFGCGTVRDWLIGMAVVLPDGRLVRNGGKVVKNVAGFDLCRLFIGAQHSLGVIVEATFKLQPLPESEAHLAKRFDALGQAEDCLEQIWSSALQPVVLDLHRIDGDGLTMVVSVAGPDADVAAQADELKVLGFEGNASLDYDAKYRALPHTWESVAPGKLMGRLKQLESNFVARAGNGVIYHNEKPSAAGGNPGEFAVLERRLKQEFDPENKMPVLQRK